MKILLTAAQQESFLTWARQITSAEVDAGCEPSGVRVEVTFGGPFGNHAEAVAGSQRLELGSVEVELCLVARQEIETN